MNTAIISVLFLVITSSSNFFGWTRFKYFSEFTDSKPVSSSKIDSVFVTRSNNKLFKIKFTGDSLSSMQNFNLDEKEYIGKKIIFRKNKKDICHIGKILRIDSNSYKMKIKLSSIDEDREILWWNYYIIVEATKENIEKLNSGTDNEVEWFYQTYDFLKLNR